MISIKSNTKILCALFAILLVVILYFFYSFIKNTNVPIVEFKEDSISRGNPSSAFSNYPSYYEDSSSGVGGAWPAISSGDLLVPDWGNRVRSSILSVQKELGQNPSGSYDTVLARILNIESLVPSPNFNVPGNLTITGNLGGVKQVFLFTRGNSTQITAGGYSKTQIDGKDVVNPYNGYKLTSNGHITGFNCDFDKVSGTGGGQLRVNIVYGSFWGTGGQYYYIDVPVLIASSHTYKDKVELGSSYAVTKNQYLSVVLYNDLGNATFTLENAKFNVEVKYD